MVGEEIRRLRKEKGMTLKQLANNIDLSHTYLSQIELGDRNVSLEMLSKLASVLEVSKLHLYKAADLLDETDILALLDENKRLREALEDISCHVDTHLQVIISNALEGDKYRI
ncbi:helix-turn-helix transcriptional regulator [Lysinibacillus sp. 1 U-2021]|uniref:helix-turn-helix domain-containing protein n=1 Tax=Lysinibacillus sp. 1 U-2021 TaxID=3039426 RepID=UPI002480C370|nr:helix-turn-helix transcriptional regulator [Lysinibacillus sp. 1 U-2021]WGT38530.1 helix-turn-helix transcriptional regulator [Lysinibacillus sp. 1 U-2021]